MDFLILIGRILFGLIFLISGLGGHLLKLDMMAGYAESRGVKPGKPLVFLTGLQILLGGLSVILGIWMDLGALLLAIFLVATAFLMHPYWKVEPEMKQMEQTQFLKDLALAGAALMILGFNVLAGDQLGLTITGPLFVGG